MNSKDICDKYNVTSLSKADLTYASLFGADLSHAYLHSADFRHADLSSANLSQANLFKADLRNADLSSADLRHANLSFANLRYADLRHANLSHALLDGANMVSTKYSPLSVLSIAKTKVLSNALTIELMRWDATVCGADAMISWAHGGACPFSGNLMRPFEFQEERGLAVSVVSWTPTMNLMELWMALARELEITL